MAESEIFMTEMYDEGVVTEVIRPAAVVPEEAARAVLVELALRDVQYGGHGLGLNLATCPRATLASPPQPFHY